jgi:hypothetical protein
MAVNSLRTAAILSQSFSVYVLRRKSTGRGPLGPRVSCGCGSRDTPAEVAAMPPCLGGLPSARRAERRASGAAESGSEARADAVCRRLDAFVRPLHCCAAVQREGTRPQPVLYFLGSYLHGYAAGQQEGTVATCTVYSRATVGRVRPSARWCFVPVVGSVVRGALRRLRW